MQNIETHINKKDISFEVMRTVACFFVVVNHVFNSYFKLFNKVSYSSWLFATSIRSSAFFAVPLFIMISGALVLRKDISISKAIHKAFRFLLVLILWSAAYILINNIYLAKQTLSIPQIISMFLSNKIIYHLWYLYMLIGLYITLPFIRKLFSNIDLKLQKYYIIVFLSLSFINMIPTLISTFFNLKINIYIMVPFMDWYIGCLFLGYYINNIKLTKEKFVKSTIGFLAINIFSISLTCLDSLKSKKIVANYYSYNYINVILAGVCIFIIIKYISRYISAKSLLGRFFYFIGTISFEIYLIHPMVISFYEKRMQKHLINFIPKLSLSYLFELLFVFVLSAIIAYLIKLIVLQVKNILRL